MKARGSDGEVLTCEARFEVSRSVGATGRIRRGELVAFGEKLDWYSRAEFHSVIELGVGLESRTAAAVVSQLNPHQCEDRTHGKNTRRAGRDQVAE